MITKVISAGLQEDVNTYQPQYSLPSSQTLACDIRGLIERVASPRLSEIYLPEARDQTIVSFLLPPNLPQNATSYFLFVFIHQNKITLVISSLEQRRKSSMDRRRLSVTHGSMAGKLALTAAQTDYSGILDDGARGVLCSLAVA